MLHATALLPPVPALPNRQQTLLHSFARKSWHQTGNCAAVDSKARIQKFQFEQASTWLSAALICWSAGVLYTCT